MKKRFSDEQIISILREAEAGVRRTVVAHVFGERTLATLEYCRPLRSWYG